jgi:serine/threonine protein kinase/Tfp pilus assembly protein PilF
MIGSIISHYKILEKLGEGGMGIVYKAEDMKLKRTVALKFLPAEFTRDEEAKRRFIHEAQTASALQHHNICTIHDIDETDEEQLYIVMDCYEGESLQEKIAQGSMKLEKAVAIALQIAGGLAKAHMKGIVHRDIKPANIFITTEGTVKILDFGLAKLSGHGSRTEVDTTLGTAAYMSPEQARGEETDQRTDIWSLGVVLYEIVTGHRPFKGTYEQAVIYAILNEEPPAVHSLQPDIPPLLERTIAKMLQKDRNQRFQYIEEIAAVLYNIQQTSADSSTMKTKSFKKIIIAAVVILILAITSVYFFYLRTGSPSVRSKSIAVLPFMNLSDSKEDEYFSDGITDDIIAQLSKISDLKVISHTSVMQYKETRKNVREIGRELDVGSVLEGSVRRVGNQVRVVAQLIDARNEGHLWADTYDKEITQILAVQSDLAQRIAAALEAKMSPAIRSSIEKKQTENTAAYELYLKGRFYWNKRTVPDLEQSIQYFNQAIEQDPSYALAYAGLANSYGILPAFGLSAREHYQKAQEATTKALEFDSTLAEVHTVLGLIKENHYNWTYAEREYRRAIELNPSYPTAHQWYSGLLATLGRFDEALSEIQRALELDPLSMIINYSLSAILYYMHQYDRADEQCNKGIELDPNFPWNYYIKGLVAEVHGKLDEAIKTYQKASLYAYNDPLALGDIGRSYARAGRKDEALAVLNELFKYHQQGYAVSYAIAWVYYGLGDQEKTFEWLENAIHDQAGIHEDFKNNPLWDDLRSDVRFITLINKIGLASGIGPKY